MSCNSLFGFEGSAWSLLLQSAHCTPCCVFTTSSVEVMTAFCVLYRV